MIHIENISNRNQESFTSRRGFLKACSEPEHSFSAFE